MTYAVIHGIKRDELHTAHDVAGDNHREIIITEDGYRMIVAENTAGYDDHTPDEY